jgi:glycosyltransferase involved in cell wall biosynthesis
MPKTGTAGSPSHLRSARSHEARRFLPSYPLHGAAADTPISQFRSRVAYPSLSVSGSVLYSRDPGACGPRRAVRVLLINHYAGSDQMGMEYRPFYLAREWIAAGHQVTILAASFSHLRGHQPAVRADLETTEEEAVRFRWLRTGSYRGNGADRVANILAFSGKLLTYAGRIASDERPDIVICSSTYPLDIHGGKRIARAANARLVFEVHDLWPLTPILLGGYSRWHPYIRFLQHAEDKAYREADVVVSILPHARQYMVERGLCPTKFVHIPNGVPASRMLADAAAELPLEVTRLIDGERGKGRFLIGFAGGINLNMALETLVSAAASLSAAEVSFLVAGDGSRARLLGEQVNAAQLDNFHLLGRIPKRAVQPFLSRMDALAIPWHRNPLYHFGQSPNKVFDYMLAGKPILQANDASNDLIAEAGCGFTAEPENPAAFADALNRLRALPEHERLRLGENGRRFVLANHDCAVLAQRFLAAVLTR